VDLQAARTRLAKLERDVRLDDVDNLRGRISALNFIAEVVDYVRWRPAEEGWSTLGPRAEALRRHLGALNEELFNALREQIRLGTLPATALRRRFDACTDYTPAQKGSIHSGPDRLDVLLDGLLGITAPAAPREPPWPDALHYEPTPARAVLDLVDNVGWESRDVFYDLGSGMGRVVILVHLLTGLPAKGVEIDPILCEQARQAAQRLNLASVEFIEANARETDYAEGTIFFLFTPFKDSTWRAVLDKLHEASRQRELKLCTYGPCTLAAVQEPWLASLDGNADHTFKVALFRSR